MNYFMQAINSTKVVIEKVTFEFYSPETESRGRKSEHLSRVRRKLTDEQQ